MQSRKNVQDSANQRLSLRYVLCLFFLVWVIAPISLRAQCSVQNDAFLPGEHIEYKLYFNWKFIWIKAGTASLTVDTTTYKSRPAYKFDLLSVSSKGIDFFFRMRDTLTSIVSERLEPLYYRKGAEEGKYYTVDQAWFSYGDGLSHVRQQRMYDDGRIVEMECADSCCIFDMVSILGQARSYDAGDYTVGQKIRFMMATGRRVEEQTLIYRGIETVEGEDGLHYRCLVFSFVEYDKKNREQEVITFFISDDKNHLPIRLDMYLNIGSAKAFFKSVKGNRYPITSIVSKKKKRH